MKNKIKNYACLFKNNFPIFVSLFLVYLNLIFCIHSKLCADSDFAYTLPPSKPDILVNIHIGKTGGSTMNEILIRHYGKVAGEIVDCTVQPEQYYPYRSIRKIREDFYTNNFKFTGNYISEVLYHLYTTIKDFLKGLYKGEILYKGEMKFTGGHIGLEVLNFFPKDKDVKAFAIIRDPKSLVMSHFWYAWKNLDDKQKGELNVLELDKALMGFIRESAQYNNDISRWFSRNNKFYDNNVPLTEEEFENIKNNIKNDFLFVGLSHKFEETLIALRRLMGWPFDEDLFYNIKNKTEFKMPEDAYPDSILDPVKERFFFDQKLYRWIEQRFNSLTKLLGDDFDEEVRIFKSLNYLYQTGSPMFAAQLQKVQENYSWAH